MTSLTEDTPLPHEFLGDEVTSRLTVASGETIYAGQWVQYGTTPQEVRDLQDNATTGFAGYAMTGGTAGEVIEVRQRGGLITSLAATVAAGDEGDPVYGDSSGTADNNPTSSHITLASNLPVGMIGRVITAGTTGANSVMLRYAADGLRG